jgi:hypothetical protein
LAVKSGIDNGMSDSPTEGACRASVEVTATFSVVGMESGINGIV